MNLMNPSFILWKLIGAIVLSTGVSEAIAMLVKLVSDLFSITYPIKKNNATLSCLVDPTLESTNMQTPEKFFGEKSLEKAKVILLAHVDH